MDIFSEKSIDAATVEDITEKANIGKGTLYRHFAEKEEVVLVLVEDAIKHLIEHLRSYPDEPETLEVVFEHFLNAHYDFFAENSLESLIKETLPSIVSGGNSSKVIYNNFMAGPCKARLLNTAC